MLGLERCPVAKSLFCSYRDLSSAPGIHAGQLITAGDISSKRSKGLLQVPALECTHVCMHMYAHTCRTESFVETVTLLFCPVTFSCETTGLIIGRAHGSFYCHIMIYFQTLPDYWELLPIICYHIQQGRRFQLPLCFMSMGLK